MQRILSRFFGSRTHTHRPARPKRVSLRLEALEQRDLMAVTAATLNAGVLHVVTDSANNQVQIREESSGPIILLTNPGAAAAPPSQTIVVTDLTRTNNNTFTFNRSEVQRIEVDMGAGNDRLSSNVTVPMIARAGAGNDFIETGFARDVIFAGEGNDTVHAADGAGKVVFGEDGDDVLVGGNGNDELSGNGGADVIMGGAGNDIIDGGDNATANRLFGELGNDVSYNSLRRKVRNESLLFKLHLGTRPTVLHKVLKAFKSDLSLRTGAALGEVLDQLSSGKPVIPLIAPGKRSLHYVVLNGFDLDNQTVRFVDVSGTSKSMSFAEFERHWKWENFFTGIVGRLERAGLKILGLRSHTFLA
jgi:hypothetical protein